MRIQIIAETKKIPRHYHFIGVSIVKAGLSLANPELMESMYNFEGNQANKMMRPFTGAIYLNGYTLEHEEFTIHQDIRITISSSDIAFMLTLYNGLLVQQHIQYKSYTLNIKDVKFLPEKLPTKSQALFRTNSTIVMKDKNNQYLNIDDPNYEKELNYAANECLKSIVGRALHQPLVFTPVAMQKKVVQLKHDKFINLNAKGILYLNGFEGSFVLGGHAEDLALLTQVGLGFRRSQMLGCIEMINE
ncbi:CRISPR-associated endoribonuclease Cas6 [Lysinibacillus macroides]|uniref:CRISPR-associated protein n=1 Tax=Lysinibacillus macroides TaxID=33935 RepID=A0A0M9DLM7_9BACI|nr:CRISPR-associated endoribonuclease Cas6 [Lysinibacillus macroides]KOY83409.1 CRISPR-associated protein [Lysinibacillus macroides]QPR69278.1 CRISPR-associated endoribonuclease Cas6 [Lysinibacillus macroides]